MSWSEDDTPDLTSLVHRLRSEVEDVLEAFDVLPDRLATLDGQLHELARTVHDVDARSQQQSTTHRELLALVKRLGARVEWLERNIRLNADTAEAELDDVTPAEVGLAQVAEAGYIARLTLLTPSARSGLESAVRAHEEAIRSQHGRREQTLEICAVLAGTERTDPRHVDAATNFRPCVEELRRAQLRSHQLAEPAVDAAHRLLTDDRQQVELAADLAAGQDAWDELIDRLRARVAEAVGSGALLPTWFTGVLGPIPPAQDTRPWMDAATKLLAYRITYGVDDPILALGPVPGPDRPARERAWHDQLKREFRELQN